MLYLAEGNQFILPVSPWWILVCILAGIIVASIAYLKHKFPDGSKLKTTLAILRGFNFALIAALLLSPFFRSRQSISIDPVLLVLKDNSSSVKQGMSAEDLSSFNESFSTIEKSLSKDFDVKSYAFGNDLVQKDTLDYSAKSTDVTKALKQLLSENVNQHLGGIVLVSDGIYNSGMNPLYVNLKDDLPIYTVAIGDTTENNDLLLQNVRFNKTIYTGDEFEIKFDVIATNLKGNVTKLEVRDSKSKLLYQQQIGIDNDDYIKEYSTLVKAKDPGIQKYSISLTELEGEVTNLNNRQTIYVQTIDGRQEVVLLYDAPHPDVKSLRQAIEAKENYSFSAMSVSDFNVSDIANVGIFIFHGLNDKQGNWNAILDRAKEENIPSFYILPPTFSSILFNRSQNIAEVSLASTAGHEIFPALNRQFNYFILNEQLSNGFQNYPPLIAPLVNFKFTVEHQRLLDQKIAGQVEDEGLMWMSIDGKRRIATLLGEGIWRWRMSEYAKSNEAKNFDRLFGQTIQYLSVKEDRRKFRIETNKSVFQESEEIILTGLLYNENYELINSSDVFATVLSDDGTEYEYVLNKSQNAYEINMGSLPEGSYSVAGKTVVNGKTLVANYRFTVEPVYLEEMSLQADHRLLYQLSENTGGKMFTANQLTNLEQTIRSDNHMKPVLSSTFSTKPIIEYKWLMIAILLLLGVEWFLRKYYGSI